MTTEALPIYYGRFIGVLDERSHNLVCSFLAADGVQRAVSLYLDPANPTLKPNLGVRRLNEMMEQTIGTLKFTYYPHDQSSLNREQRSDWIKWNTAVNNALCERYLIEAGEIGQRRLIPRDLFNNTIKVITTD